MGLMENGQPNERKLIIGDTSIFHEKPWLREEGWNFTPGTHEILNQRGLGVFSLTPFTIQSAIRAYFAGVLKQWLSSLLV